MEKIISVKNLRKAYKKETAVQNVCFELAPGNIMGLLGTNGAGKTTTLKMITNLCSKDNGKIVIDNVSLDENPGLALSKVGAALDTPGFYQELTARENILDEENKNQNSSGMLFLLLSQVCFFWTFP